MENFLRLEHGRNKIRIMNQPEVRMVHFGMSSGQIRKENCNGHNCNTCKTGATPKQRVSLIVLDRSDGEFKRLEVGPMIYKQILDLVMYNHINIKTHDVIINRASTPGTKSYNYNVMPGKESFLTIEEQRKYDEFCGITVDKIENNDICNKCGSNGIISGMACICNSCGNIIWGC